MHTNARFSEKMQTHASSLTNPGRDPPPPLPRRRLVPDDPPHRPPAVPDPRAGRGPDGPGLPGPGQRGAGSRRFAFRKAQPYGGSSGCRGAAPPPQHSAAQRLEPAAAQRLDDWSRRQPGEEIMVWVLL